MKKLSEEHKRKIGESNRGKIRSLELRRRWSKSHMGLKNSLGYKHTVETRKKMSEVRKGKKLSEKTIKKISETHKGIKKPWLSELLSKQIGEKNHNWKGGISRDKHGDKKNREWRLKVFIRDGFTCQVCRTVGGYLQAHHIKSWSKYPELRYELLNGITLCEDCHKKTDNYGSH